MRATRQILGCALCVAIVGSAAAATLNAQGIESAAQAASSRSSHDGDSTGGNAVRMSHDNNGAASSGGATNTPSRNGNDRSAATASAPTPAARPHLGWQSLLPGSIQ